MKVTTQLKIITLLFLLMSVSVFKVQAAEVGKSQPVTIETLNKLTPEQAYQTGKLLQQQMKNGAPYLKYAADKGLAKAARGYAHTKGGNLILQNEDEAKYLLIGAELGDVWAMMAMSGATSYVRAGEKMIWANKTLAIFHERAKAGNSSAMFGLALFYNGENQSLSDDWLEKATEQGLPIAQYNWARHYEAGKGWFIIPGKREKEIRRLYKAAADSGYIPARSSYADYFLKDNNWEGGFKLVLKNIADGDAVSLITAADAYLGNSHFFSDVPEDRVKGISYYQIFIKAMGTQSGDQNYRDRINNQFMTMHSKLNELEKKQVNDIAEAYLSTHTVRMFDVFWVFDE